MLANGGERDLPLNRWRGFAYEASAPSELAVGLIAYADGSSEGAIRLPQTATASDVPPAEPVYGIFRTSPAGKTMTISPVSSRTLRRADGLSLRIAAQYLGPMALSPDASRLALETDRPARLLIVDLRRMRILRSLPLPAANAIRGLAWPQPDRLLELRQRMGGLYDRDVRSRTVWIVDPATGARVGTGTLTNKLAIRGSFATPAGLVLLLGSSGLHGPDMQLALVSPTRVQTLTLPVGARHGVTRTSVLAVDATGGRAYVVVAGGTVFDVDLGTMTATRHTVALPAGAPTSPAPASVLQAHVLGDGLAVAGALGGTRPPRGVYLIDTTTWTARVVDRDASFLTTLRDRLATYGETIVDRPKPFPPDRLAGVGLALYDASGALVRRLYGGRRFGDVALTPGYGHLLVSTPNRVALQPRTGRVFYLGPDAQLVFDLGSGAPLGRSRLVTPQMPLGPPLLIFRGSAAIGES